MENLVIFQYNRKSNYIFNLIKSLVIYFKIMENLVIF